MKSILIKDTTKEEREQIIADSVGNIDGLCDGCSPGLLRMYEDYIEGRKELQEINMEFRSNFVSGAAGPEKSGCDFSPVNHPVTDHEDAVPTCVCFHPPEGTAFLKGKQYRWGYIIDGCTVYHETGDRWNAGTIEFYQHFQPLKKDKL